MKKFIHLLAIFVTTLGYAQVQNTDALQIKKSSVNWYVAPEIGAMFLHSHVGKTVGLQMGFRLFKDKLKIGYFFYGRSGPINNKTFATDLQPGVTYKGKSQLQLRGDHGAFGIMIAPRFKLPNSKVEFDVPVMIGSVIAGFYLAGDDRKTPDERRVSEWENELFQENDAAGAGLTEIGLRALFPTKNPSVTIGVGVHYTMVSDLKTYYDPSGEFYANKLRTSLFIQFGNIRENIR
jgi:hypothetical protein